MQKKTGLPSRQMGFSLVELSIVLVILGLLAGGVLTGQSLIRAAELRSVITQMDAFRTATNTFRDKYFAVPGDMANASAFWGLSTACTGGSASGVCNGDGNGMIFETSLPGSGGTPQEMFGFWQHLSKAGLIEGNYTGIAGPTYDYSVVGGTNSPATKLKNGAWFVRTIASDANYYANFFGKNLLMAGNLTGGWASNALLPPEDLWNVDTKVDDGKPGTGVLGSMHDFDSCVVTPNDPTTSYAVNTTGNVCGIISILK